MLQQVARLFGMSSARKNRAARLSAAARRRRFFAESHRNARFEQLEARQVMAAALHSVAAANIDVVQNDTGNATTSVTVTAPYSINDFQIRTGSNRGDTNIQIGPNAADDVPNGILISNIRDVDRDNGPDEAVLGVRQGTSAIDGSLAGGYYIPQFATGGGEYNFDLAAAYFPYADYLGGWLRNSAGTNSGPNDLLTGSASLVLGTHVVDQGGGNTLIDLRSLGINSQTDGVLIVEGGKNEANFALSIANADGTWTIFCHDNGANGASYEQDYVGFVYVPLNDPSLISGKFRGGANNISLQSDPFTVTNPSGGIYHLEIAGQSPTTGVLIISAEGGAGNNVDNVVAFEASGTGWDIHTRDLPGAGLQNIGTADAVVSFVFIPGPTPGISVTPTTGLLTTENGDTATFELVLDTLPTADVTIDLSSSDPAEGTLSTNSVTFTPANWNVPQVVTITGQDDAVADRAKNYSIVTAAAVSSDPIYSGLDAADVSVVNADNEPGVTINPPTGLITTEAGGTASFTVVLNTAPTADVTIALTSSDLLEGTISANSLIFTAADWNTPQTVTVTGVSDFVDDGDMVYSIVTAPSASADPLYNNFNTPDVAVTNTDDDTAGITVTVVPLTGLTVSENATTADFSVVLNSQPTANVTIGLASTDTTEGSLSASSLLFTAANWNVPQIVTVTGVNDLTGDGDIALSIVTTTTTSDALYAAIDPSDVTVVNLDNDPILSVTGELLQYGAGAAALVIDPLATVTDPLSTNYNNYQLVVSLTANAHAGDRIAIRNYGTETGQVGVTGSNVTFAGTTVGTFAGGSGATPLTVTFNSSATPATAEAVLRAITFRNINANPPQTTRTAAIVINALGGNASNTVTRNIQVGLVRVTELQEGVDRGTGVYNGQVDIQLTESQPNNAHPVGSTAGELLVDFPNASNAAQILLKYNNLIGTGAGQIPLGATILSAELLVNVKNPGQAGTLHRLLTPWNENTETWNSFGNGLLPRNGAGGVQLDNGEARSEFDSQWGLIGSGTTGTDVVSIGVTNDLIAWANGEVNEGWVINGWTGQTDGTAISPSEDANPLLRPRLKVKWLPPGVSSATFREGLNGYFGAVDTSVQSGFPDDPLGSDFTLGVDGGSPVDVSQTLLRFDNIIGTGVGQIPPGAQIHSATLVLSSTTSNAMGDGGRFFPMVQSWDSFSTWNSLGGGIQTDGIEAATTFTTQAGVAARTPDVQGGYNPFDVTTDVQAWVNGSRDNNGWAILPWASGTDGWFFGSSNILIESSRPTLQVFYTMPGVTVTPTSGLFTSETGATATFTVQLDTQPSANVTIPLSSDDASEGTVIPASVTFTPENWNIPQTVTVTGVDDALPDGSVSYNILTGPATSSDPFYNNFDAADVSVSNSDNETAGVTVQPLTGLITNESGGTAAFTIVLNTAPTANVTISLTSSDTSEGSVAPSVVFTSANWNVPQTVTVTGVDDNQIDGPITYQIITGATVSTDTNYSNLAVFDVSLTNEDNDVAGVIITPTSGLQTTEAGGTATFTVALATQPTDNVTFDFFSNNTAAGTVSPGSLVFTSADWNVPQTVTLTGVSNPLSDIPVDYTIVTNVVSSGDVNYQGLNPADVLATNVDPRPFLTLPEGTKLFGFGGSVVLVDFEATIADFDSLNFDTGSLTVQTTAGGSADDRLEIRSVGTAAGQIGVAGSNVSFGGANIGTFAGGVGTTPLVITLNTAATQAATEALLRAVTFRNLSATFANSTRTVEVTLNDGDGNSSTPVSKTVVVGMRRETAFQEGADAGNGVYAGAADIQLLQSSPTTAFPTGSSAAGLSVAGSTGTANSQVLLRFGNIFGNGPGQIPLGSIITSAYLDMDVNDTGQGPVFRRMLTGWDANTATWDSLNGGIQADNAEARTAIESTLNTATGNGAATGVGLISVGVTADLQAWSNGEANNGWALMAFQPSNTNAFIFSPSEAADIADRPKLRIEWIPGGAANNSFRQGVNGYADVVDTQLTQTTPTVANNTGVDLFVDFTDNATTPNATHVLLKFDNIVGALAGQVPPGTKVYSAVLTLPGTGSANTPGDGGSLHKMLIPWDATASWSTFTDGVQNDGLEATVAESARAGNETRAPNAQAGYNTYDVTGDVQSWLDGTADNNGWAWLPWVSGSDGWAISSSEAANVNNRPMLTIYFEPGPNVAPVNTIPVGSVNGTEDTNLPLSGANGISVSDVDAGANPLTTTISVPSTAVGTFTANNGGGTANVTTSNGGATITIVGPQTEINTALTTLIFVPALNRDSSVGTTTITVSTFDGLATDTDTFNVTLAPINDAPTFTAANPPAVNEDAPAVSVPGFISAFNAGPNESSQAVTSYNVTNVSNGSLFTVAPTIANNGTLSYTLAANQFGSATFDVTVTDNGGTANGGVATSSVQTFTITVNPINDAPSYVKGADLNVGFNAGAQTVTGWATAISAGPLNENTQTVSFNVSNNNGTLFAVAPTIASNGTLQFTAATGASGTATITVVAQDNGGTANGGVNQSASQTFVINVAAAPVNALPTITAIGNATINEDAPLQTVNFSGVTAGGDTPAQAVSITVSSSNPTLIPTPTVSYTSPATTGSLSFTPAANLSGSSIITVTVRDSGLDLIPGNIDDGSITTTFTVTVNSVNDVPNFTVGQNQTVNEDAAAQTVNGFITVSSPGASNESSQALSYNITANSNPGLFAVAPSISSTGVLTYTPAADAFGVATITVTVSDDGGIANGGVDTSGSQTFTITLDPVNDAPSFVKGSDLLIPFNSLAQTIPGWATALSTGPANESTQTLSFVVTGNSNPSLFSVAPGIASDGTLTFTHTPGQQGSATITVRVTDDGGTAAGGINQSATQTFVITVDAPVNGLPTINNIPTLSLPEDAGLTTVNLGGITAGGEVQDLQVTVTSSNTALIPTPTVNYTSANTTGSLTFASAANASGSSTITVTVRDAGFNLTLGDSDDGITVRTFDVNFTPVNDPVDASDSSFNTLVNTPVSSTFNATDIDGPALTFSILMAPALGTLTSFDTATGAFTYTPAPDAVGLEIFSFSVTDGQSTDTAQVRISITPLVPTVVPSGGDLLILGTAAPDTIIVSVSTAGNALVRLQSGSYSSTGSLPLTGTIRVESGAGNDYIVISGLTGPTHLDAGPDNDYVSGGMGNDTIIGGSGHDQINASGGDNIVWGDVPGEQDLAAGGNDVLSSLGGNDVMYGGGGDDQLFAGAGNDYIHGGQGNDLASGDVGDDRIYGGGGNDVLAGDAGNDILSGNSGNDQLLGREGNDLLIGGSGSLPDAINGGGGDDLLVGSGATNDSSFTAGDANDTALLALLANWNTTHAAGLLSGIIATDDGAADVIGGSTGDDDFYVHLSDLRSDLNATAMGTDREFM